MLEQVSWTALEPKAANDAALLLGKHFLAPVSANEALRAFRRCLHSILCDERVLDIVGASVEAVGGLLRFLGFL